MVSTQSLGTRHLQREIKLKNLAASRLKRKANIRRHRQKTKASIRCRNQVVSIKRRSQAASLLKRRRKRKRATSEQESDAGCVWDVDLHSIFNFILILRCISVEKLGPSCILCSGISVHWRSLLVIAWVWKALECLTQSILYLKYVYFWLTMCL